MEGLKPPRWLVPLLIVVLVGGVVIGRHFLEPAHPSAQTLVCADLQAGCAVQLPGRVARVGVTGELKGLAPFEVWLKGEDIGQVTARFSMEGMDMGLNLYTLRRGQDGVFRARVTLPVCSSGVRDWVMTLEIDGSSLAIPFVTKL